MELTKIEKLSDYKKAAKAFIRGAIKAKIFNDDKNALAVTVTKDVDNVVGVEITNGAYSANFDTVVATRVYNKIDTLFFQTLTKQFNTLKNFGGVKVEVKSLAKTK
jgi:hypothetical protein